MTQTLLLAMGLFVALYIAGSYYYDNWVNRLAVLTLFVCLANAIYFSLDGVKGWPAEEEKEVKGTLATVVIINPSDKGKGGIIISLFPSTPTKWYEYEYHRYAPKTYFVEYSNDRAAQFEAAKKALMEGKEVRINGIPDAVSPAGEEGNGEEGIESVADIVGNFLEKILPKQGDTYRPEIPDIEIMQQTVPPQKGTNQ